MERCRIVRDMVRPDFLGIGAQKAATNWIWHNLRQHPDIWVPPYKELHYFDRSTRYPSPSYLSSPRVVTRLTSKERHNVEFRRLFIHNLASSVRHARWSDLRWQLRHFFGYYDDHWYVSLFREGAGKVKGEITPSYSILEDTDVKAIRGTLPSLKIIFIMRNPIDRAWSHVRFDWTTGRFANIDSMEAITAFIESPNQSLRSDYIRTIDIWAKYFPPEQLFVGFYDDVIGNPAGLLDDLHRFLGVSPRTYETAGKVTEKIFTSNEKRIPAELLRYLAERYRPDIEQLSRQFGGHAASWLAETDRILAG